AVPDLDVILVRVPRRGIMVPVSRRELLAALGIGAATGALLPALHRAVGDVHVDEQLLAELDQTVRGLQTAGRVMPPAQMVRPLTGQVTVIDAVRRRAQKPLRRGYTVLQARCAESLSWMAEEAGDMPAALYWTDRAQHWAMLADWPSMVAYGHVRRS